MAGRIEVHPELVAIRFAWLYRMLRRAECQQLRLDGVDIVDGQVEVELLRPLAGRPRRRCELLRQLECHAKPVHCEHDPVVLVKRDVAADDALVELGQGPRIGAVKDYGAHAGEWHGQQFSMNGTIRAST